MKRYMAYILMLVLLVSIWIGLIAMMHYSIISTDKWGPTIYALPFFTLVSLGSYCIGKLGFDLLTFNDYPKEITALEKDIIAAQKDLSKRGFKHS